MTDELDDVEDLYGDKPEDECADCGRTHLTVLEALVCDEFTDARRRRTAAHQHRTQANQPMRRLALRPRHEP